MIANEALQKKIEKELKPLKLDKETEAKMVRELNYLSDLLIEVYVKESGRMNQG